MDVVKNVPDKIRRNGSVTNTRNIYIGTVFILAGIIWMLYNLDLLSRSFFHVIFSWQVLLIAIGGYLLSARKWVAGSIVGIVGVFFLIVNIFDITLPIGEIILPAAAIAIGVAIIFSRK